MVEDTGAWLGDELRRLAPEQLRELFLAAFSKLPCPVYLRNAEGRLEFGNPEFAARFLAASVGFDELEDREALEREEARSYEIRSAPETGLPLCFEVRTAPFRSADGEKHLVGVVLDTSALSNRLLLAQAESASLRAEGEHLQSQVNDLRLGFLEEFIGSSAKSQSLEELVVKARVLLEETCAKLESAASEGNPRLADAFANVTELSHLLRELGEVAVTTSNPTGERPLFSLDDLLADACSHAEDLASRNNVLFEVKLEGALPKFIRADERALRDSLRELLRAQISVAAGGWVALRVHFARECSSWTELRFTVEARGKDLMPGEPRLGRLRQFTEQLDGQVGTEEDGSCPALWISVPVSR